MYKKECFIVFHIGRTVTNVNVKSFKGARVMDLVRAVQRVADRLKIKCWVSGVMK